MIRKPTALLAALALVAAGAAAAQDEESPPQAAPSPAGEFAPPGAATALEAGRQEFLAACAACHGETAAGDGPLAALLSVPVPDLTGLAAANGGAFPMLDVIHVIDGRGGMRAHGGLMPVWGARFRAEAAARGDVAAEIMVRGRVLALASWLESIQQ